MVRERGDGPGMLGAIALAAVCCALPLLLISGIGLVGGIAWGKIVLVFIALAVLGVALGQATARMLRRQRGE